MQQQRLDGLDGMRAISVSLVIAGHVLRWSSVGDVVPHWLSHPASALAVVGVQLFFGISGFVICRGFMREAAASGGVSLRAFYIRRAFRILPPLLLYVAAVVALVGLGFLGHDALKVLLGLTFTCDLKYDLCGGAPGRHLWSLSVEEQFYLVIPALFVLIGSTRRWALAAIALAIPLLVMGLYALKRPDAAALLFNFTVIGFGVACALYEDVARSLAERAPWWTYAMATVAMLALWFWSPSPLSTMAKAALFAPCVLWLLMGAAFRRGLLIRILASEPMRKFGLVSYSVYLWQQLATYPWPGATVGFYLLSVLACIGFAFASFYGMERPLIRLGARLSARISGSAERQRPQRLTPDTPPRPGRAAARDPGVADPKAAEEAQ